MMLSISCWGNKADFSCRAAQKSWRVFNGCWCDATLVYPCSMGFKSAEWADHPRFQYLSLPRKHKLCICDEVGLSPISMKSGATEPCNSCTLGPKTLSWHLAAFKACWFTPAVSWRGVMVVNIITAHTIRHLPWYQSLSKIVFHVICRSIKNRSPDQTGTHQCKENWPTVWPSRWHVVIPLETLPRVKTHQGYAL